MAQLCDSQRSRGTALAPENQIYVVVARHPAVVTDLGSLDDPRPAQWLANPPALKEMLMLLFCFVLIVYCSQS